MVTVEIEMSLEECRTLYQAVSEALENSYGFPALPSEEQEKFKRLKFFLFTIMCEASIDT